MDADIGWLRHIPNWHCTTMTLEYKIFTHLSICIHNRTDKTVTVQAGQADIICSRHSADLCFCTSSNWTHNHTWQSIKVDLANTSSVQDASYWRYSFICIGIGSASICVFGTCCKMQSRQAFCNVATANRQYQTLFSQPKWFISKHTLLSFYNIPVVIIMGCLKLYINENPMSVKINLRKLKKRV